MSTDTRGTPELDDTTTRTVHETDAGVLNNRIVAVETASDAVTLVGFVRDGAQSSEVEHAVTDLREGLLARYGGQR